jgi:heme exporter protein D
MFYVGLQPHLPAKLASLAYAIVYVCLVALAVYPLYRRRIFLRL